MIASINNLKKKEMQKIVILNIAISYYYIILLYCIYYYLYYKVSQSNSAQNISAYLNIVVNIVNIFH